jgi:precorrin-6A/cobalt-precorrin-6A reductase
VQVRVVHRVAVLAGTTEAFALAARLTGVGGIEVISSFAGETTRRRQPAGAVRVGRFGGAGQLGQWLNAERISAVVDATHPFAEAMPWQAAEACALRGIPRLRLLRRAWAPESGDRWHDVARLADAPGALRALSAGRVFLTVGSRRLAVFSGLTDVWFLVRSIEPPMPLSLAQATVVTGRGPFELAAERATFTSHRIDCLVTNNSGGQSVGAKLVAARELGVPVIMVRRPPVPPGLSVPTVDEAVAWCQRVTGFE